MEGVAIKFVIQLLGLELSVTLLMLGVVLNYYNLGWGRVFDQPLR